MIVLTAQFQTTAVSSCLATRSVGPLNGKDYPFGSVSMVSAGANFDVFEQAVHIKVLPSAALTAVPSLTPRA